MKGTILTVKIWRLAVWIALGACGCSYFVPAYDTPISKEHQKEKEKAEKEAPGPPKRLDAQ